ncbi:MAG: endonuclease MutS2, partial [Clostridiales bacterium]|nr:endonuclease MutS2 [Clostridiales bacterium]
MTESPLMQKALRVLEFTKIREQLASYALTEAGAALCHQLLPFDNLQDARYAQAETEEALMLLTYRGDNPLQRFQDIRPSLGRALKGATLSPRALLDVADCLRATSIAKAALDGEEEKRPILSGLSTVLTTNYPLERRLKDSIISEDEIADNASPALADIRRQLRLHNDRVKEKLRAFTQGSAAKYLQESIVTVRNGRYVIPVRQEYRQFVPGLVHDQSSSGATLFIEPMSVVELGNELKQWTLKEEQEIERILGELSDQIAGQAPLIKSNVEILIQLDYIFAKGTLARAMGAISPRMNDVGQIRFVRVRHPLIDRASVVPCDLWLGED